MPNSEHPRKQKSSLPRDASPKKHEYTSEQVALVKRIRACKDYYEILCISKDATDSEIKKAYKKIALRLHPDKNRAPGADEAFKAVGNDFEGEVNPEELRRGWRWQRLAAVLLPILIAILLSMALSFFISDPAFSLPAGGSGRYPIISSTGFGYNVYVRRGGRWQRLAASLFGLFLEKVCKRFARKPKKM